MLFGQLALVFAAVLRIDNHRSRPMIIDQQVIAFAGIAALLTIAPAQDTMLVIRNVMEHGQRSGFLTTLGICCAPQKSHVRFAPESRHSPCKTNVRYRQRDCRPRSCSGGQSKRQTGAIFFRSS
jgi:hypothetical protein